MCQNLAYDHMLIDSAYVSACIDAGKGNIGQANQSNDDFIQAGNTGYTTLAEPTIFTQTQTQTPAQTTGTFSIDASQWNNFNDLFIGFKFGTGNQPDNWFVYQLKDGVSSGSYTFINVFDRGGGLSHLALYGKGTPVPDTGSTLIFLGIVVFGLLVLGRKYAAV
jgi:hypothetical protein